MSFKIEEIEGLLSKVLDFKSITAVKEIQSLWSGYGSLLSIQLEGAAYASVIVKWINLTADVVIKRTWDSKFSHDRKLKSYQNEKTWYQYYAFLLNGFCKLPNYIGHEEEGDRLLLVMTNLNEEGFTDIRMNLAYDEVKTCLSWLANLHAFFLKDEITDLWEEGTYWHLATRPDEFDAMDAGPLRDKAQYIDQALKSSKYLTVLHGDAKAANFLFNKLNEVAAVDFQYTGIGCGMKDVVYLLSCLGEEMNEYLEEDYLAHYFTALREACTTCCIDINLNDLEGNWRALYPFAWADFERFLEGWSPGHWKMTDYSNRLIEKALATLK